MTSNIMEGTMGGKDAIVAEAKAAGARAERIKLREMDPWAREAYLAKTELEDCNAQGNDWYPQAVIEKCLAIDSTFKVTFLVHDEIAFECKEENWEAIRRVLISKQDAR